MEMEILKRISKRSATAAVPAEAGRGVFLAALFFRRFRARFLGQNQMDNLAAPPGYPQIRAV